MPRYAESAYPSKQAFKGRIDPAVEGDIDQTIVAGLVRLKVGEDRLRFAGKAGGRQFAGKTG
jgi:hypothetical protein